MQSILNILEWISVFALLGLAANHIYVLIRISKRNARPFLKWLRLSIRNRVEADIIAREALRNRLGHTLIHNSSRVLLFLRFMLIVAVFWLYCRLRLLTPPWLSDAGAPFASTFSEFLIILTAIYGCLTLWFFHHAEHTQARFIKDNMALDFSTTTWSQTFPDVFYIPALADVIYLLLVGVFLPSPSAEIHMGLFIPVMSAILFRAEGRTFYLLISIVICLLCHWYWLGLVLSDMHLYAPWHQKVFVAPFAYNSFHYLFGTTLPRIAFWSLACFLMMLVRVIRRNAETQSEFFRALSDALPFDVFVKDHQRAMYFVNKNMLTKLRIVKAAPDLTLADIQGKTDLELGVEPEKAAFYENVDSQLLAGTLPMFRDYEPDYIPLSNANIETVKVPISNREKKPSFILGLCRALPTESDHWFFTNIVHTKHSLAFFRKDLKDNEFRFKWVNEQFARDTGRHSQEIVNMTDHQLYAPESATAFNQDDIGVIHGNQNEVYEYEEWHQPINGPRRRVHVMKQAVVSGGTPVGVRGYFFDVHEAYLRHLCSDSILRHQIQGCLNILEQYLKDNHTTAATNSTDILHGIKICIGMVMALNMREPSTHRPGSQLQEMDRWHNAEARMNDLCATPLIAIHTLVPIYKVLYKKVIIDVQREWLENKNPRIDCQWLQIGTAGLFMFACERIKRYGADKKKIFVQVGCETLKVNGKDQLMFFVAVHDYAKDVQTKKMTVDDLAQYADEKRIDMVAGLLVTLRTAEKCNGKVLRVNRPDQQDGSVFKFYVPC